MASTPETTPTALSNQFISEAFRVQKTDPLASNIYLGYVDFMSDVKHANWLEDLGAEKQKYGSFSLGHNIRQLQYLFHYVLFNKFPRVTPTTFPDPKDCAKLLTEIYEDEHEKSNFEEMDLKFNPMTTKPTRYNALILASQLLLPNQSSFTSVDMGSGNNSGLALAHIYTNAQRRMSVGDALPSIPRIATGNKNHQSLLDRIMVDSLDRPMTAGWGFDIFHPWDSLAQSYARMCGPTKLLFDDTYKDMKTTLISHALTSPALNFALYDIAKPDFHISPPYNSDTNPVNDGSEIIYKNDPPPKEQVDIVSSMYMLYMHSPDSRKVIFDNMTKLGRHVLVLDALDGISNSPTDSPIDQLIFSKDWNDYSTHAVVFDQESPELGWQSIARSKEGDFVSIRPGKLLIKGLQKASQVLTR